jgi:hypothetical protein
VNGASGSVLGRPSGVLPSSVQAPLEPGVSLYFLGIFPGKGRVKYTRVFNDTTHFPRIGGKSLPISLFFLRVCGRARVYVCMV